VGSENEMFISGYNYKWNNLLLRDSLYNEFLINFNYTVPVNYFSMQGSYFINSYDSSIVLHPHSFFNYYEKLNYNRVINIKKIFKYFNININNFLFYNNIIMKYRKIIFYIFMKRLNIYFDKKKIYIKNIIYKYNLLYFLKFKNSINKIINYFNNNILCFNKNKNLLKENKLNININNILSKIYNNKDYKFKNKFL